MSFYNRKEEVLEIKLTPYGRYLLSTGELKPIYYSFFDDDILYDSKYAFSSSIPQRSEPLYNLENQNDIEKRIKETPRIHCQTTFRERKTTQPVYAHDEKFLQDWFEREYALNSQLGNADYYSNFAPAWDVDVLKGQISSSFMNYTGSGPSTRIPQINISSSMYIPIIGNITENRPTPNFDEDIRTITEFGDNTFLEVRDDFILLEVNEINSTFQKENFEIEFFKVSEKLQGGNYIEELVPLKFSGPAAGSSEEFVQHYFDISVDQEIDEYLLCKHKGVDSTKGLFLQRTFDCEVPAGDDSKELINPYTTDVEVEDICE